MSHTVYEFVAEYSGGGEGSVNGFLDARVGDTTILGGLRFMAENSVKIALTTLTEERVSS